MSNPVVLEFEAIRVIQALATCLAQADHDAARLAQRNRPPINPSGVVETQD